MCAAELRSSRRLIGKRRSAVLTRGRARLMHDHRREIVQLRLEPLPDPHRQVLARGILESRHIVQVAVIELVINRLKGLLDVAVIHDPALFRIERSTYCNFDIKGMTMEPSAFVLGRQSWE